MPRHVSTSKLQDAVPLGGREERPEEQKRKAVEAMHGEQGGGEEARRRRRAGLSHWSARDGRRRGARKREGEGQGEDGAAEGSMRGESGAHESKRGRIGASGQQEREIALDETEDTRETRTGAERRHKGRQQRCRAQQQ